MPDRDVDRPRSMCPFLGTRDDEGKPAPCVDYPSFENMCFVAAQPETIMLTDQATFCLSSGHRHCPRLVSQIDVTSSSRSGGTSSEAAGGFASANASDPLQHAIADIEEALEARRRSRVKRKKRWGWIGLMAIFVSSLICGGFVAAYVGWRLVNPETAATTAGSVTTVAELATLAPPPVYLIVTATSDSVDNSRTTVEPDTQALAFPPAVTATPATSGNDGAGSNSARVFDQFGSSPRVPAGREAAPAAPAMNMLVEIPTRRPTPVLDLAITVPVAPEATIVPSPTPTPALGTPVVVFAAEDSELESGKCTTVSWHVENVRAVYYENLGVDGHGEAEECIRDKPGDYTLTVVLPNGGTKYYTVTVGLILPTSTPTPTRTQPPVVEPTATWTPVIPTDTPTPDMQYGVLLSVAGGTKRSCAPGGACDAELRVTNTSLGIDDISIVFLTSGNWDARLCRLDGVCSDSKLTLASVGPGNTALVTLTVDVPGDASGDPQVYVMRAISERSGGTAGSEAVSTTFLAE